MADIERSRSIERAQLSREMTARSLEHATWIALFNAQTLRDQGIDTAALENQLTTIVAATASLRQRIEDFGHRLEGVSL